MGERLVTPLPGKEEAMQQSGQQSGQHCGQQRGRNPTWHAGAELSAMNVSAGVASPWRTAPVLEEARRSVAAVEWRTAPVLEAARRSVAAVEPDRSQDDDDAGLTVGPGDPFGAIKKT